MIRQPKPAPSRTYAADVAQLRVDEIAGDNRRLTLLKNVSQKGPSAGVGESRLATVVEFLDSAIPLPNNLRSFAVYCVVLLVVAGGMLVHVLLSVEILEAEVALAGIQARHTMVKRQNGELLWMIGRATNLQQVQDRAKAAGYVPISERQFVQTINLTERTAQSPAGALAQNQSAPPANNSPPLVQNQIEGTELTAALAEEGQGAGGIGPPTYATRVQQWWALLFQQSATEGAGPDGETPGDQAIRQPEPAPSNGISLGDRWRTGWAEQVVDSVTAFFSRTDGQ